MKIEVVAVRLVHPKESGLCGFADVKLDAILIRDFRIFQRNGKPFIQPPHTTFRKDGQIKFNPIVDFPEELKAQVNAVILTSFFREKKQTHEHESE